MYRQGGTVHGTGLRWQAQAPVASQWRPTCDLPDVAPAEVCVGGRRSGLLGWGPWGKRRGLHPCLPCRYVHDQCPFPGVELQGVGLAAEAVGSLTLIVCRGYVGGSNRHHVPREHELSALGHLFHQAIIARFSPPAPFSSGSTKRRMWFEGRAMHLSLSCVNFQKCAPTRPSSNCCSLVQFLDQLNPCS